MSTPSLQIIFRGLAIVASILAMAQPVLGSFSFFRPGDSVSYDTIHTAVGSAIYYSYPLLALLAFFAGFRRRWIIIGCCVLQVGMIHGQLLLGVESGTNVTMLAYHIPLGVLILVFSLLIVLLSFGATLKSDQA